MKTVQICYTSQSASLLHFYKSPFFEFILPFNSKSLDFMNRLERGHQKRLAFVHSPIDLQTESHE